jgi:hypothetical protein
MISHSNVKNQHDLILQDEDYGFNRITGEWVLMKEIISIKELNGYKRKEIRGLDYNGKLLYFQINDDIFEQLTQKGLYKFEGEIQKRQ